MMDLSRGFTWAAPENREPLVLYAVLARLTRTELSLFKFLNFCLKLRLWGIMAAF